MILIGSVIGIIYYPIVNLVYITEFSERPYVGLLLFVVISIILVFLQVMVIWGLKRDKLWSKVLSLLIGVSVLIDISGAGVVDFSVVNVFVFVLIVPQILMNYFLGYPELINKK